MKNTLSTLLLLSATLSWSATPPSPTVTPAATASAAPSASNCSTLFETDQAPSIIAQKPETVSLSFESKGAPRIELQKRMELMLVAQSKLETLVPIREKQKETQPETLYAGHAQFQSGVAGKYTFVASKGLWIEVIDPATHKALSSTHHQMAKNVMNCKPFHKAVGFNLEADKLYSIQFTGNSEPQADFLIVKANE